MSGKRLAFTLRTSDLGVLEMMSHEAIVLDVYLDSKGVPTLGVGVTDAAGAAIKPSTFKGSITLGQAMSMFADLLPEYEAYVHRLLANAGVDYIHQHEFDALVSLAWNVGGGLAVRSNTVGTRARIARGDIAGAIDLWRKDKPLWSRRDKEVALARTGTYTARSIMVYRAGEYGEVLFRSGKRLMAAIALRLFNDARVAAQCGAA